MRAEPGVPAPLLLVLQRHLVKARRADRISGFFIILFLL
jgi:hypothetical protein